MIAHLRGTLLEKHPNLALIEVGGVGYGVLIPVSTFSQLPDLGKEVRLWTHTHVREDLLALYGFATPREQTIFEHLITVTGIGPRLAITILSGLPPDELLAAIRAGDSKRLVRVPGIGRKTGERIILELREKLGGLDAAADGAAPVAPEQAAAHDDVVSALMNLGCQRDAAEKAVRKALAEGASEEFDPLFRRSLELISR